MPAFLEMDLVGCLLVFIYFYVIYIALGLQNSNYALVRGIKFNRLIPKTLSPNDPLDHQTHSVGFQKHDGLTYVAKYGFIKFGQHHDMFSTLALFMSILAMIIVMIAISKTISCQGASCFAPLRIGLG